LGRENGGFSISSWAQPAPDDVILKGLGLFHNKEAHG